MARKKVIEATLSEKGIRGMIDELEKFADDLDRKTALIVNRLSKSGYHNVSARVGSVSPFYRVDSDGGDVSVTLDFVDGSDYVVATITMSGGSSIIIEFGSGVTFNAPVGASKHPLGVETGYTIGSYPGQTHADSPYGWYFRDHFGKQQHTYGTPTYAPLWNAYLDMKREVTQIAQEIFNG